MHDTVGQSYKHVQFEEMKSEAKGTITLTISFFEVPVQAVNGFSLNHLQKIFVSNRAVDGKAKVVFKSKRFQIASNATPMIH